LKSCSIDLASDIGELADAWPDDNKDRMVNETEESRPRQEETEKERKEEAKESLPKETEETEESPCELDLSASAATGQAAFSSSRRARPA
jgi:hypothetical protein